jgi:hypothetical protein
MLWLNRRAAPTMGHAPLLLLFANQFCLSIVTDFKFKPVHKIQFITVISQFQHF